MNVNREILENQKVMMLAISKLITAHSGGIIDVIGGTQTNVELTKRYCITEKILDGREKADNHDPDTGNKWIPCSERLPEKAVICCDEEGGMLIGFLEKNVTGYFAYDDDGAGLHNCVAWMPLPEPYEEGK